MNTVVFLYTGYYKSNPNQTQNSQHYGTSGYLRPYDFLGVVLDYNLETGLALVKQRNRFQVGDTAEIVNPTGENIAITINRIINNETGKA